MKTTRLLISLVILAAGPFATVFFFITRGAKPAAAIVICVSIIGAIAALVSVVAHLKLKRPAIATLASVAISEVLLVILLMIYIACVLDVRALAMWLPITMEFQIPWGFPTALSVSYGAGRITRDLMAAKNRVPTKRLLMEPISDRPSKTE